MSRAALLRFPWRAAPANAMLARRLSRHVLAAAALVGSRSELHGPAGSRVAVPSTAALAVLGSPGAIRSSLGPLTEEAPPRERKLTRSMNRRRSEGPPAAAKRTRSPGSLRSEEPPAKGRKLTHAKSSASARARSRTSYAEGVDLSAPGFLEAASLTKAVRGRYDKYLQEFKEFSGLKEPDTAPTREVDAAMVEWMESRYENGRAANDGAQMLAAFECKFQEYGKHGKLRLTRAHRALVGWRRLRPPHSRPPLAWEMVAGLAVLLAIRGFLQMALWVLITTSAYLRPGEAMALEPLNFAPAHPPGVPLWSLLVRPSELEIPSKTNEFDDTVIWDHAHLQWMTTYFEAWRRTSRPGSVWTFTYRELCQQITQAAEDLQLQDVVPYALRHTGASTDAQRGWRSLQAIQKRGRWRCHQSVARYEKSGRVGLGWGKIRKPVRRWLEGCAANLEAYIRHPALAPRPPVL